VLYLEYFLINLYVPVRTLSRYMYIKYQETPRT